MSSITFMKTIRGLHQLRVSEGVITSADGRVPTEPATLDDLAAAIRGMAPSERVDLTAKAGLPVPCASCDEQLGELRRDLADARNALEIAKAEAERMSAKIRQQKDEICSLHDTRQGLEKQAAGLIGNLGSVREELAEARKTISQLDELLTATKKLLHAAADHPQPPIEVEPEWVRRMPEWFRAELAGVLYHESLIILGATQRQAIYSLVASIASVDNGEYDVAVQNLHVAAGHALRAAYLARKAGGE